MSTSMHEVFNWNGPKTSAAPKRLTLSVASTQIDFEGPSKVEKPSATYAARNRHSMVMVDSGRGEILKKLGKSDIIVLNCINFCC